jgi:hypothetical protein
VVLGVFITVAFIGSLRDGMNNVFDALSELAEQHRRRRDL